MTIISHEHRFIFIKTAKTAGTSIELVLEKICGPDDICAPITQKDESRPNEEGYCPRHWRGFFWPDPSSLDLREFRFHKELRDLAKLRKYRAHMPAKRIRWRLGKKAWDRYFKFTVERNPWDKAVSSYFWARRHRQHKIPFEDWIQSGVKFRGGASFGMYSIDGEVAVDHIMRFENLHEDLADVLNNLGVENSPELPQAKTGFRPSGVDYHEIHNSVTRDFIARSCAREIALMGYEF